MFRSGALVLALFWSVNIGFSQPSETLTARELFFVPTGATISRPAPAKPKAPAPAPKTKSEPVVAQNQTKPKSQPGTGGVGFTPVSVPAAMDAPVQIVSASYSGPRPLGLRYSILRRAENDWREVNPDAVFHSGDKLRVRVESNEAGYLYIVARGSSGAWDVLFPSREVNGGDNHIQANVETMLPNRSGQWTLDDRKGEERLFLVLARRPVADLDTLIYDLNSGSKSEATPAKKASPEKKDPPRTLMAQRTSVDDALVGRLRNQMVARDLVFEKVEDAVEDKTTKRKETAVYIVDKSGKPDARLVADVRIKHE